MLRWLAEMNIHKYAPYLLVLLCTACFDEETTSCEQELEPCHSIDIMGFDAGSSDVSTSDVEDIIDTPIEPDVGVSDVDQIPPQGAAALNEWLATGVYLNWNCEIAPVNRDSAHGSNRVCSNDIIAQDLQSSNVTPWRQGAAAVKELYNDNLSTIIGYAVYIKTAPNSSNGENWYWYEIINNSIVADTLGDGFCARCHSRAEDSQTGARDFVYLPVGF